MNFKFSIGTIYWGDYECLRRHIEHAKNFTDDIVILNINLFGEYTHPDAQIINVPFNFLFQHGYADGWNIITSHTKYDWFYPLAAGKEIVHINKAALENIPEEVAAFTVFETGNEKERWFKLCNSKKTKWVGHIHEEPYPLIMQGIYYQFSETEVLEWKRRSYEFDPITDLICRNYRQLTRLKWIAELQNGNNRIGTNNWWWTLYPHKKKALEAYKKYMQAYEANFTNLILLLKTWQIKESF